MEQWPLGFQFLIVYFNMKQWSGCSLNTTNCLLHCWQSTMFAQGWRWKMIIGITDDLQKLEIEMKINIIIKEDTYNCVFSSSYKTRRVNLNISYPLHLEHITFFENHNFLDVPLYKSSKEIFRGCTTYSPWFLPSSYWAATYNYLT